MKFTDFGRKFAKPIKAIQQYTDSLPKPIQQSVVFFAIIAGLPIFLMGFLALRIWAYKNIPLDISFELTSNVQEEVDYSLTPLGDGLYIDELSGYVHSYDE